MNETEIKISRATDKARKLVGALEHELENARKSFTQLLNQDAAKQAPFKMGDIICRKRKVGRGARQHEQVRHYRVLGVLGTRTFSNKYSVGYKVVAIRKDGSSGQEDYIDYYETGFFCKEEA